MKLQEVISNYLEMCSSESFNIRKLCKLFAFRQHPTLVFLLSERNCVNFPSLFFYYNPFTLIAVSPETFRKLLKFPSFWCYFLLFKKGGVEEHEIYGYIQTAAIPFELPWRSFLCLSILQSTATSLVSR
jgi:hypothetical protein